MEELIICIVLLGSAFLSQDAVEYNKAVYRVEEISGVELPFELEYGMLSVTAYKLHRKNLAVLTNTTLTVENSSE